MPAAAVAFTVAVAAVATPAAVADRRVVAGARPAVARAHPAAVDITKQSKVEG